MNLLGKIGIRGVKKDSITRIENEYTERLHKVARVLGVKPRTLEILGTKRMLDCYSISELRYILDYLEIEE